VVSTLELDQLLNLITQQAMTLLQADGGILNLVDWERNEDEVVACTGLAVSEVGVRSPLEGGLSGWVTLHNQPVISDQLQNDSRVDRRGLARLEEEIDKQIQNAAVAPLTIKDQVVGTLVVIDKQGGKGEFDQSDLDLLVAFANQAAAAIENARLFEAEQRRAEQFRVISEVGRRMTSLLAVDELLWEIARLIKETLGYYLVGIALTEKDELIFKAGAGGVWEIPQFQPPRLKVGREGITGWVAQSGEPLLVPDVSQEPRYYSVPEASEIRSELAVPLKTKEAVIGVLHVQSGHLNAFDKSDLVVLQSLAHQAAIAIENAQLFAERERRIDEMAVLNEVGWAISSTLRLDELLNLIHHQVGRVMDATNLYIALYHRDDDGVSFPLYVEGDRIRRDVHGRKAGRGLTEYIIRNRQPLLLSDNVEDRTQELGIESVGTPAKSWLGVPMIAGDEVLGVIAVQSYTTEDVYDEEHLNLLSTIAAQAAIAIENARLYEQARELAVVEERQRLARDLHDAVTQTLFSASLIAEVLPRIWERNPDEGRHRLEELRELTRGALAEMRTLLLELRPSALVEAELGDLLRQLAESITGRARVPVTVEVEGECSLPPEVKVAMYRVAQEALNNVAKHAGASQATVNLHCQPRQVELHVSDDGCGFDPEDILSESLGLGIMRERAEAIGATLTVESEIGCGTEVIVVWTEDE